MKGKQGFFIIKTHSHNFSEILNIHKHFVGIVKYKGQIGFLS